MIITEPKELIAKFVSDGINQHESWDTHSTIGYIKDDQLVAGVVYNYYSYTNICAHIHAKVLSKDFMFAIFDYPFNELKVQRITGLVPKKNKKARKFNEDLGFKFEGCMRNAIKGDSLIVYGMLKEECKWLKS